MFDHFWRRSTRKQWEIQCLKARLSERKGLKKPKIVIEHMFAALRDHEAAGSTPVTPTK